MLGDLLDVWYSEWWDGLTGLTGGQIILPPAAPLLAQNISPPTIPLLGGGPALPTSPLLLHLHAQEQLKHQHRQQSRGLDYTWQNTGGISAQMYNFCDITYLESIILTFLANLWCFHKIVFSLAHSDHSATVTQLTSHLNINPSILPNSTPATAFFAPSVRVEDLRFFTFKIFFSHLTAHCQGFHTRYPAILISSQWPKFWILKMKC